MHKTEELHEIACPVCDLEHIQEDLDICPQCDSDLSCFKVLDSFADNFSDTLSDNQENMEFKANNSNQEDMEFNVNNSNQKNMEFNYNNSIPLYAKIPDAINREYNNKRTWPDLATPNNENETVHFHGKAEILPEESRKTSFWQYSSVAFWDSALIIGCAVVVMMLLHHASLKINEQFNTTTAQVKALSESESRIDQNLRQLDVMISQGMADADRLADELEKISSMMQSAQTLQ
ncbi:MAG: hypothetical protein HQK65_21030 [Desulfamplus sp.]|nr:hypothetical protein [Desulfamplus sp.]